MTDGDGGTERIAAALLSIDDVCGILLLPRAETAVVDVLLAVTVLVLLLELELLLLLLVIVAGLAVMRCPMMAVTLSRGPPCSAQVCKILSISFICSG